jgi:hypothetical protein
MTHDAIPQPNATTFTLEDIVAQVLAGRVRVPSFQRTFRWQWEDVRRLFDSIVKGYPIGNLLLWERVAKAQSIRIGALEIDAPSGTALWVVDGQQRVTSLANALTDQGARDPLFSLAFNLESEAFEKLDPMIEQPHLLPLPVIFDLQRLLSWFAQHPEVKPLFERATRVAKAVRQFAIPAYVVKQQDEGVLRDIFDRMNNYGRRLSRAEVFSALHGGRAPGGSDIKLSDIADQVDAETGFGRLDDDTVLRAVLARRGGDVTREIRNEFKVNDESARDFAGESPETAYREGQRALVHAIEFLQDTAGVPHFGFLPYRYLVVVLTRFFAHFPDPSHRNRELLRRWFWRAALVGPNVARGSWTGAMRALATRIKAGDESGSVQQLLVAFNEEFKGAPRNLPRLTHFRTNWSETRVILCALWSMQPRSPVSGAPYDGSELSRTLSDGMTATDALKTFFPRAPEPMRRWAANRVLLLDDVLDEASVAFTGGISDFAASTRKRILESHALDNTMIMALLREDAEAFLKSRQQWLDSVLRTFIERVTESQFEDTPPLDDLSLDEGEGRDDDGQE